jgi:lipid A 3-O-deacylase
MVIARICRVRSFGWIAALVACVAYLAAGRAAKSADMPPPSSAETASAIPPGLAVSSYAPGSQFEARFGVFAAGIGSVEQGTADLNGSFLTPRLNVGAPGYLAYLLPRFQLGGAVNLSGRTSFAYFDAAFTLPITQWLFFEPFVGGAIHNGSVTATPTLSGLGCPLLFHAGVSVGIPITERWSVLGSFEHLSNGKGFGVDCGTNQSPGTNQGLNNYGLSVGYAF